MKSWGELQLCQTRNGRIFQPFAITPTDNKLLRYILLEEYMTYKIRERATKPFYYCCFLLCYRQLHVLFILILQN